MRIISELNTSPAAIDDALPPARAKIDSLTALRFFAAASIVLFHSKGRFGISPRVNIFGLQQGVAFFFVLSGFILTYVYPSMKSVGGATRFFVARIARIWPAYLVALFAALVVNHRLTEAFSYPALLASITMLQAWIPLDRLNGFVNGPSWSISTEMFFYLCFPLLIFRFEKRWPLMLIASAGILIALFAFCGWKKIPNWTGSSVGVSLRGMIYMNPLGRLFEFTLGMCAARVFAIVWPRYRSTKIVATVVEVIAIALAIAGMYFAVTLSPVVGKAAGDAAGEWTHKGGLACFPFAILIVIMAMQRGWISALLDHPFLILLGELSYSVYLLQSCPLDYYQHHHAALDVYRGWIVYSGIWIILLVASYATWSLIERPCRKWIVSLYPSHRPARNITRERSLFNPSWQWGAGSLALLVVLLIGVHFAVR